MGVYRVWVATFAVVLLSACGGGGGGGPPPVIHYTVADFGTVQDFLGNPIVQDLLSRAGITTHAGSTPPIVEGTYEISEVIFMNDIPPHTTGAVAPYTSVFSGQAGGRISLDDGDTVGQAFITGSGGDFTLWSVFAVDIPGYACTVVEVDVVSGSVLPGGDIDARLGSVIVGASGIDCGALAGLISGGSVDGMRGIVIASLGSLTFLGPP